jgi:hypothetical protein
MRPNRHPRRPLLLLALLLALAAPPPAGAQDDRRLIRDRLETEGPQNILVVVDGSREHVIAAGQSAVLSKGLDPGAILVLPRYERPKQQALCGIPDFTVTGDALSQPIVSAVVSSVAGLQVLLARPGVLSVHRNAPLGPGDGLLLLPLPVAKLTLAAVPWEGGPTFSCAFAPGQTQAIWLYGDWSGSGQEAVGKYVPALDAFLLDANGNGLWDGVDGGDLRIVLAPGQGPGTPLVGDWNGDGRDGVAKGVGGRFYIDANEDGVWSGAAGGDIQSWVSGEVLVGDWDGDGDDELGQYLRPARRFPPGSFPPELDRFLLDDGDGVWQGPPTDRSVVIASVPLCPGTPIAFDWDPARPGDGVGKSWGRTLEPDFGYALDLDEDGVWRGNPGGDLLVVGSRVEYCGPLPEL